MLPRFCRRLSTITYRCGPIHSLRSRPSPVPLSIASKLHCSSSAALKSSIHGGLDDLQLELQQLAIDFTNAELKPHAKEWDRNKRVSYDTLRKAAGLGFGSLYISEENGGLGLSRHDTTLMYEILSQGCVSTTALLTIHTMTAWMLDVCHSDPELKEEYLPKMVNMDLVGSYCLTEPHCGSDAAALKTKATKDGDHYIINGSKAFISGGGVNDLYFVMCRTDFTADKTKGITCFMVPHAEHKDTVSFGDNEVKMGWHGSPTATVFFDNVRLHKRYRIGAENEGFKYAMKALDGGRLNIAACSLGAAHRCLEEAVKYALDNRPTFEAGNLAAFQNVQFEIANLAANLHCSRLMLRDAAKKLDEGHPLSTMYCAMAKKKVTDLGFDICNRALQIFGGYGYLSEYEIERFVRDTRVHQILEGTNEIMNLVVSRFMLDPKLNNMS